MNWKINFTISSIDSYQYAESRQNHEEISMDKTGGTMWKKLERKDDLSFTTNYNKRLFQIITLYYE